MGRAIEYHTLSGPEVLGEAERPTQAPDDEEMRITVHAIGLDPFGFKTFRGNLRRPERVQRTLRPRHWLEGASARFPRGVTRDFTDVIDTVGASVTDLTVGGTVLGILRSAPDQADTRGALTIELVAPADDAIKKPAPLSLTQAACLSATAQTARGAFKQLNVYEDNVVVISAAADGVGSVVSQLVVNRGATIVGIAGARGMDYLRSLGAIPVTYGESLTSRIRDAAPSPVAKLLDYYGGTYVGSGRDLGLMGRPIGTPVPSPAAIVRGVQFTSSRHSSGRGDLEEVVELVAGSTIKVGLARTYSFTLEQIRAACTELARSHVHGKLVIGLS